MPAPGSRCPRKPGTGTVTYRRTPAGGSWTVRLPQVGSASPSVLPGRYAFRAQAEAALDAYLLDDLADRVPDPHTQAQRFD